MSSRFRLIGVGLIAALVVSAGLLYDPRNLFDALFDDDAAASGSALRDTQIASIETLTDDYSVDATLVFGDPLEIVVMIPGVVTEIVEESSTVSRGDVLWRVVDEPTTALFGDVPAHRTLRVDDVGDDVEQLEMNLVSLGYDAEDTVTVDDTFTTNTELMVERWQTDIGADITGEVLFGSVIFVPEIRRTGSVSYRVGEAMAAGTTALTLTSSQRIVEFAVPAAERDTIAIGDTVSGQLPDRSSFAATVTSIVTGDDGEISATAVPDEAVEYLVDMVPVTISWEVSRGETVLAVPAGALVHTDSDQYYVEVRSPSGAERLVAVDVGRTSGQLVEVTGDLEAGDAVVSP